MKKVWLVFLFAASLGAQVQLGRNVQIGAAAGINMQQQVIASGQYVVVYPTTAAVTGVRRANISLTPNYQGATVVFPGTCGGLNDCFAEVVWSGFSLPSGLDPASVTSITPFAIYSTGGSDPTGFTVSVASVSPAGSLGGLGASVSVPLTQATGGTGMTGAQISSATIDWQWHTTVGGVNNAAFNVASIGLIVYYTGTPVTTPNAITVTPPLDFNQATNTLGIDQWALSYSNAVNIGFLPPASSVSGKAFVINDGASSTDCTTGGGTNKVWCYSNGTAYSQFGGGGGGAVSSVANSDGTLTISPTTGSVVGSLNLAHANTWTATQTLSGLTLSWITGSTQCLHVNTSGVVSGTGSDCGAGAGTVTGSGTTGYIPAWTSSTALGNSHIDDGVTTASTITATEKIAVADGTGVGGTVSLAEGTAATGALGRDVVYADSTTHRAIQNPNNTGNVILSGTTAARTSGHCVAFDTNGIDLVDAGGACGISGGGSAFSAITTGTNTSAAMVVGSGASLAPLGTGTIQANNISGTVAAGANVTVTGSGTAASPFTIAAAASPALPALVAAPTAPSKTFLQAINNAANQVVNIVVAGDSFTISDQTSRSTGPTVSTNRWPEQLRIQLQAIYGSHGTGMVPLVDTVSGGPKIYPEAWSCTGTYDFSTGTLGPGQSSGQAGNTLVHLANGASCTFHDSRNIAWDSLNTYCMTTASSGSLAVNIDSGAFTGTACGTTSGSATAHVVTLAATSSTSHSVTFTSTGDSYLYAAEGTKGTTGVSVHVIGVGGALAEMYGNNAANKLAFSDLIPTGTQAFVYMDQTNDAVVPVSTSTFQTYVQNIITHEQGLTGTPTVVLAIPPVDIVNGTDPLAPYTTVQQNLCNSNSLTCINAQDRWGTAYNSASGLWDLSGTAWPSGNGGVHPNDKGCLDEAQMIYARLVNPTVPGSPYGLLTTQTLSGTNTVTISIPGGYRDLQVVVRGASTAAATFDEAFIRFNGDTGANYDLEQGVSNNTSAAPVSQVNINHAYIGWLPAASGVANMGGAAEATVFDYGNTSFHKAVQSVSGVKTSSAGTGFYTQTDTSWWRSTAAITSITVYLNTGNFASGSSISVYGRN